MIFSKCILYPLVRWNVQQQHRKIKEMVYSAPIHLETLGWWASVYLKESVSLLCRRGRSCFQTTDKICPCLFTLIKHWFPVIGLRCGQNTCWLTLNPSRQIPLAGKITFHSAALLQESNMMNRKYGARMNLFLLGIMGWNYPSQETIN